MHLICKLIGHKSKQYLQVLDMPSIGEEWVINEQIITKKIHTYFLCIRCLQRNRQSEVFTKEKINNDKYV